MMVALMGVFDVTARIAHHALALPANQLFNAGWQRQRWLDLVSPVDPSLASICARGTDARALLTILSLLRNSVHGEALKAWGSSNRDEIIMVLPRGDTNELMTAMGQLGGTAEWGVERIFDGRMHVLGPELLVENILERTTALLNELMENTPVEQFSHVDSPSLDSSPPVDQPLPASPVWNSSTRLSVRWQLGFDEP
jgi:hypothetical protein